MRSVFLLTLLLTLICAAAALAEAPPMDIPIYAGGEATMEINLTNEDLLPTLQAILPMVKLPGMEKVDPNEIAAAFKDVQRIQMLQLEVAKQSTEEQIADFYGKKLPAGKWNKVFWQKIGKSGTLVLFVEGMGEKLYGFRVQSAMADDKPIKRVQILKAEGKLDYVKLLTVAAKMYMPEI